MYTTIRELIENSLDACETIQKLPSIQIHIQEYTRKEFNQLTTNDLRLNLHLEDASTFTAAATTVSESTENISNGGGKESSYEPTDKKLFEESKAKQTKRANEQQQQSKQQSNQYYLITVIDNGCGMAHDAIPEMFGRVLSGSKYGVRQTRGKFGLGAKMALIWSKKSTGHPIHILTSTQNNNSTAANGGAPTHVSSCILDIDIYRNQPRIIEHAKILNTTGYQGTAVRVLIAGNWTTYKSRIVQYIQQLAIITPYAELSMTYTESGAAGKRNVQFVYHRRSEQIPDLPSTVKHHPSSVNNIIVQQLIQQTKTKNIVSFLNQEFQAISVPLAKRLIAEFAETVIGIHEDQNPNALSDTQITRLVQLFHQVQLFRPPDGTCLSPLGEYNLNLGIQKVLEPDLIATARDRVSVYEGHSFMVEAAVSIGGNNAKEGVAVYRFANRIPLLFEGGADVATRVAMTKIKWSNYKIDYKRDKVGVFVSIVSTKIPFKGTSKEYIGDDGTCRRAMAPLFVFATPV